MRSTYARGEAEAMVDDAADEIARLTTKVVRLTTGVDAVLRLCESGGDWMDDGRYWVRAGDVTTLLGGKS
jgi:hypothetical protein